MVWDEGGAIREVVTARPGKNLAVKKTFTFRVKYAWSKGPQKTPQKGGGGLNPAEYSLLAVTLVLSLSQGYVEITMII